MFFLICCHSTWQTHKFGRHSLFHSLSSLSALVKYDCSLQNGTDATGDTERLAQTSCWNLSPNSPIVHTVSVLNQTVGSRLALANWLSIKQRELYSRALYGDYDIGRAGNQSSCPKSWKRIWTTLPLSKKMGGPSFCAGLNSRGALWECTMCWTLQGRSAEGHFDRWYQVSTANSYSVLLRLWQF